MRRPCLTGVQALDRPPIQTNANVYKNDKSSFNPLDLLTTALGYGQTIWSKVNSLPLLDALPLIDLTFLLEEHIQSLIEVCNYSNFLHNTNDNLIILLSQFYQSEELSAPFSKRGSSLRKLCINRVNKSSVLSEHTSTNYYDPLFDELPEEEPLSLPLIERNTFTKSTMKVAEVQTQASFPEDLTISEVATSIRQRQTTAMEEDEETEPQTNPIPNSPPKTTMINTATVLTPTNVRINLIRHKFATPTEQTSLQLFKSFILTAKKTDPSLIVLPIDSTKQHLSSLTTLKQVENLTNNQLRLYFSSWYRDQPHSISGFLHLHTTLDLEDMLTKVPLAEWLATYQYSIKLCCSQDEEMSIIGALCYGSLFLHRDDLLKTIVQLPEWAKLNHGKEKPIVIDLVVKPFKCPGKSSDMIFVRSERSKKDEATKFFLKLYDGTPKRYPRGDMLLFIPVTSKLDAEYTDTQRAKYLFNHQAYLGDEDCFAIFGLSNLETLLTLKDGKLTTIRTLLKSLPASDGMSRPRLFQVVDLVPSQDCVIVTFQRSDRPLVEERQFALEVELRDQLAPGEATKLFTNEVTGLRFGLANHKNKGKVIKIHNPSQVHQDFVHYADSLLSSPPKKRSHASMNKTDLASKTINSTAAGNISYSGVVQAQTTHTRSVADPNGVTTTTTTQTSQTVMAVVETRFQTIEHEQKSIKNRLSSVEQRTMSTDENIRAMMAHWKITPAPIKRKFIDENAENESITGNANLLVMPDQGQGDTCL